MANPKRKASKSSKKGNRRKKARRASLKSQNESSRTVMEVDVPILPNNYPPSNSRNSETSLYPLKLFADYNHQSLSSQLKDLHKDVIWCQHQAFFHPEIVNQVKLYEAGIVVDDVIQGYLNDCWLLGPLATLTSQHQIIQQLIRSNETEVPHEVEVFFWQLGRQKSVIVDNYFPCLPRRRQGEGEENDSSKLYADLEPLYCKPNGPELWALYIEKGYATLNGSYQALHDGQDYEAMIDLTGCPAYSYTVRPLSLTTANQSIKKFEDLEKLVGHSGFITAISHDQSEDGTPLHQDQSLNNIGAPVESTKNGEGIFPHHSYSILNTLRLPHIDSNLREECFKLIKLRNPHGKHEFTGRWSDRCNYWRNEQCQKALNEIHETIIDKDEGIFWMDFENFRKYFARVNACFPNGVSFNDYCLHWTNRQTLELQGPMTESISFKYELFVPENVVCDVLVFGLHQTNLRPFLRNDYSELTLQVFSKGQSWQFKNGRHRQVQTDVLEFSPGVYHIELEIKCDANCVNRDQREYALTIHSTCADFKFTPCT